MQDTDTAQDVGTQRDEAAAATRGRRKLAVLVRVLVCTRGFRVV